MQTEKELKIFENMTIGQIKKLTIDFLKQNPDFKTAEQLLKDKLENAN